VQDPLDSVREALADRYAVERELGRGGMATVFLAEDLKHHRSVAIKVLHAELTAALGAERFLHEIEIAARLQHPHILPLYDSGAAAGFLYYVMPYVEGESLRDRLTREKQLPRTMRSASPRRWRGRWRMPTAEEWSTATSSPRTSCCRAARPW